MNNAIVISFTYLKCEYFFTFFTTNSGGVVHVYGL